MCLPLPGLIRLEGREVFFRGNRAGCCGRCRKCIAQRSVTRECSNYECPRAHICCGYLEGRGEKRCEVPMTAVLPRVASLLHEKAAIVFKTEGLYMIR